MKNFIKFLLVISFLSMPFLASAKTFDSNLYFGITNDPDVQMLQEFLTDQGVYSGPITGNFFSLTLAAVKKYQTQNNITPAAGYFGPITRTKANEILSIQIQNSDTQAIAETGTVAPTTTTNQTTNDNQSLMQTLQAQISALLQQITQMQQQNQTSSIQQQTNQPSNTQSSTQSQTQNNQNIVVNPKTPIVLDIQPLNDVTTIIEDSFGFHSVKEVSYTGHYGEVKYTPVIEPFEGINFEHADVRFINPKIKLEPASFYADYFSQLNGQGELIQKIVEAVSYLNFSIGTVPTSYDRGFKKTYQSGDSSRNVGPYAVFEVPDGSALNLNNFYFFPELSSYNYDGGKNIIEFYNSTITLKADRVEIYSCNEGYECSLSSELQQQPFSVSAKPKFIVQKKESGF